MKYFLSVEFEYDDTFIDLETLERVCVCGEHFR
jgi:hypothetical protein